MTFRLWIIDSSGEAWELDVREVVVETMEPLTVETVSGGVKFSAPEDA